MPLPLAIPVVGAVAAVGPTAASTLSTVVIPAVATIATTTGLLALINGAVGSTTGTALHRAIAMINNARGVSGIKPTTAALLSSPSNKRSIHDVTKSIKSIDIADASLKKDVPFNAASFLDKDVRFKFLNLIPDVIHVLLSSASHPNPAYINDITSIQTAYPHPFSGCRAIWDDAVRTLAIKLFAGFEADTWVSIFPISPDERDELRLAYATIAFDEIVHALSMSAKYLSLRTDPDIFRPFCNDELLTTAFCARYESILSTLGSPSGITTMLTDKMANYIISMILTAIQDITAIRNDHSDRNPIFVDKFKDNYKIYEAHKRSIEDGIAFSLRLNAPISSSFWKLKISRPIEAKTPAERKAQMILDKDYNTSRFTV